MIQISGNHDYPKPNETNIQILLQMDICSAEQDGGTHSLILSLKACNLWYWCLQINIHLSVEHLPGKENSMADLSPESWSHQLSGCYTRRSSTSAEPVTRLTAILHQLEAGSIYGCTSPRLYEVGGVCIPPLCLIVPWWCSQAWFPVLMENLVDLPLLLSNCKDLLTNQAGQTHPLGAYS